MLVDNLSNAEPYTLEQRKAMTDLFAVLQKRRLLQSTTQVKHILTSQELDILAAAIWLIDVGPIDQICTALMLMLLEHTGLRPGKLLP